MDIILRESEHGDEPSATYADLTALVDFILGKSEGGLGRPAYKVRNVSPVVGYVDGEEVITWGGM